MSQGYTYAPPTLEEAIKAYQRAKDKAKSIDSLALDRSNKLSVQDYDQKRKGFEYLLNKQSSTQSVLRKTNLLKQQRTLSDSKLIHGHRRGQSQGNIHDSGSDDHTHYNRRRDKHRDNNYDRRYDDDDRGWYDDDLSDHGRQHPSAVHHRKDYHHRSEQNGHRSHHATRYTLPQSNLQYPPMMGYQGNNNFHGNPAWSQYPYPPNSYQAPIMPQNYYPPNFPPQLNAYYPGPPYAAPLYPAIMPSYHQLPPSNIQPAVQMKAQDFRKDCKYSRSPAPSRPYSDSDLIESLSSRYDRVDQASGKFSVVPPIRKLSKGEAVKKIQRCFRQYQARKKWKHISGIVKSKFIQNFADLLIDEIITEDILPDIIIEVLLYGVKDISLPTIEEKVVQEYADMLLDEVIHESCREAVNQTMSEMIAIYKNKKPINPRSDPLLYLFDELLANEIHSTVKEFMNDYIFEIQANRLYDQLVFEEISSVVVEEFKGSTASEEEPKPKTFDLDNVILASVLSKSLLQQDDYVMDSLIAQGLAGYLKERQ